MDGSIIVELKTAESISNAHEAQVLHYLRAFGDGGRVGDEFWASCQVSSDRDAKQSEEENVDGALQGVCRHGKINVWE